MIRKRVSRRHEAALFQVHSEFREACRYEWDPGGQWAYQSSDQNARRILNFKYSGIP